MLSPTPEIEAYIHRKHDILREHARKDVNDNAVIDPQGNYELSAEGQEAAESAMQALDLEYADAKEAIRAAEADVQTYLTEPVNLILMTVPWAWVPEKVGGGFLYEIRAMIAEDVNELLRGAPIQE
jgi:hypothetical protein